MSRNRPLGRRPGPDGHSTYLIYPCNASELVHFRHRIGESGLELIFAESIRVNTKDDERNQHDTAFIDSTVQEKNVTYPTDAKLHKKIMKKELSLLRSLGLPLRQSPKTAVMSGGRMCFWRLRHTTSKEP